MSVKLKIILVIVMIIFLIYIFKSIKDSKISTKHALIWVVGDIIVIACIIFVEPMLTVAHFFGVETVSNMMFFIGFVFLLIFSFNQSNQLSYQNNKVIKLTQELGILKNKIKKEENNND